MIQAGIKKLVARMNLTYHEAAAIMEEIMTGKATEAQISAFLTAFRMKGETIEEITAFATVMREFCCKIHPHVADRLVDTCGTGGDQIKTFNISTTAAFIIAGAGIAVAKHGNRSVTSKCGSADILEQLGLNLNLEPPVVEKLIEKVGIGFMFAPRFHPAMKYALAPRKMIGIRTAFNILGPLTNPAGANAQLLGIYAEEWVEPLAHVLRELGCEEGMVVHGIGGLDEISLIGKTTIAWLRDNEVNQMKITPRDYGFKVAKPNEIAGTTPEKSAVLTFHILNNHLSEQDPRRNIVLLNAAAGIVVGGKADDLSAGLELATDALQSGVAYERLKQLVQASDGDLAKLEELERSYAGLS